MTKKAKKPETASSRVYSPEEQANLEREAGERLAIARARLRKAAPFLRAVCLSLVPRVTWGIGTIGVTNRAILVYDPAFIKSTSDAELPGLLAHECLHLVFGHLHRCGERDPRLYNVAGDLAINPCVLEIGLALPKDGCFPKNMGMPEGLTADEYYDRLMQEQPKQAGKRGKKKQEDGDEDGEGSGASSGQKGSITNGRCGSCAGNPTEGEPDEDDAEAQAEGRTERELSRMREQTARAVQEQAQKGEGRLPANLRVWADAQLAPPKVRWQDTLRRAAMRAISYRAGQVTHRYDGPSRRQAGIGYGPGRPVLPRLRAPVPNVTFIADTSGSMFGSHGETLAEVAGILKALGAPITFLACDAEVQAFGKIVDIRGAASKMVGGGGTDFRPAVTAAMRQKERPSIIVFATDGFGPAPDAPPAGVHFIWLLVGRGATKPCNWGEVITVGDT